MSRWGEFVGRMAKAGTRTRWGAGGVALSLVLTACGELSTSTGSEAATTTTTVTATTDTSASTTTTQPSTTTSAPTTSAPAATDTTDAVITPLSHAGSLGTRSHYIANPDLTDAYNLGCGDGDKQGRMSLFFGAPTAVDGVFGATLWGAPNQSTSQIAEIVKEFARGYAACRQSDSFQLLIGVGTSNSTIDSRNVFWLRAHGRAWSIMVKRLNSWAETHYPGQVLINGAWDAEPSWSAFGKAEQWIVGYNDDVARSRPLHANHSAEGCPSDTATNGACNNGWNQDKVWQLAWRHDPVLPIPQIYATSGVNARQWQQIDLYGVNQGDGMVFFGAMSQHSACAQVSGGCPGTDATPEQSHDFLLDALNSHPATSQPTLEGVTDIRWHS